jgi:hypothetical protein
LAVARQGSAGLQLNTSPPPGIMKQARWLPDTTILLKTT